MGEPEILQTFGGHAMAAGLTLRAADFDRFREAFDAVCRERMTPETLRAEIRSDGRLPADTMTLESAEIIRDGGPWGQGFEEPVFDDIFDVEDYRRVGESHWKLVLRLPNSARVFEGIAFNAVDASTGPCGLPTGAECLEWPDLATAARGTHDSHLMRIVPVPKGSKKLNTYLACTHATACNCLENRQFCCTATPRPRRRPDRSVELPVELP